MDKYLEKFRIKLEELLVDSEVTISDRVDLDGITIFKLSGTGALYNVKDLLDGLSKFILDSCDSSYNPYSRFKFYMNSLSNVVIILYNGSDTNQLSLSYLLNGDNADMDTISDNIRMTPENKLIEVLNKKYPEDVKQDPDDPEVIESMRATECLYNYIQLCEKLNEKFGDVTDSLEVFMDPKYGKLWHADYGAKKLYSNISRTIYLYTEKEYEEAILIDIANKISDSSKYFSWNLRRTQVKKNGKFTIAASFYNKFDESEFSETDITTDEAIKHIVKLISGDEYQYKLFISNTSYNIKYKPTEINDKLHIVTDKPIKLSIPLEFNDFKIEGEYVNTQIAQVLYDLKSKIINPINNFIDLMKFNKDELVEKLNSIDKEFNDYIDKSWSDRDFYNGVKIHNHYYDFIRFITKIYNCITTYDISDAMDKIESNLDELDKFLFEKFNCVFNNRVTEFDYEIDLK